MQNRSAAPVLAVLVPAAFAFLAPPVQAQDRTDSSVSTPKIELFTGYEAQRILGARGVSSSAVIWHRDLRFGVDVNVSDRVAVVLSIPRLGAGTSRVAGTSVDYAFLVGPRLRFRQRQRVMPFVQLLAGLDRGAVGRGDVPASAFEAPDRRTFFQSAVAGGIDFRLNRRFAWRAVQIEERSRFGAPPGDNHRLSVSTGIVIRFGARR